MSDIVIVDSSVLLNVLDIPGFNQHRDDVLERFGQLVDAEDHLLLPLAAVIETGDHVADLRDGRERRRYAERFRDCIHEALRDEAPWTPIEFPRPVAAARLACRLPRQGDAGTRHQRRVDH